MGFQPKNPRRPIWTMYALDGAGDDGTTLYVLHDDKSILTGVAHVPQPLLTLAEQHNAIVNNVYPPLGEVGP